MKLFLRLISIISIVTTIHAAEIFEVKTGRSFVVQSCSIVTDGIDITTCGGRICEKYPAPQFSCNTRNGDCNKNFVRSSYETGWINSNNKQLNKFESCLQKSETMSQEQCLKMAGYKYEDIQPLKTRCPFR